MKYAISIIAKLVKPIAFLVVLCALAFAGILALNKPDPKEIHAELPPAEGFVENVKRASFRTRESMTDFKVKNYGLFYQAKGEIAGSERTYTGFNGKWVVTRW